MALGRSEENRRGKPKLLIIISSSIFCGLAIALVSSASPSGGSSKAYSGEDGWVVDPAPEQE